MESSFLLYLLTGLLVGGLLAYLLTRLRIAQNFLSRAEVQSDYVPKALHRELQEQLDVQQADLREKEQELRQLDARLAALEQQRQNLEEKLSEWRQSEGQRQDRLRLEMEQLSNRILEEKARKFTQLHREQLGTLLDPLREHIKSFEEGIEKRFVEETRDRTLIKKEIEHLRTLNERLSDDAQNLTQALKGDSKTQGDWGELQLERLLESAGLEKEVHYRIQPSYTGTNGRQQRPDFLIILPEEKHLVIDSKVSLTAYERLLQATEAEDEAHHLKMHLQSLRSHIRGLSEKNYHQLYQINSPDYVLLFVPIESAFAAAFRTEPGLFTEALEKNIVPVSTSTLLATMRTVSFIWKQEKQKRNVLEIARQSGQLYDKFVAFAEDLAGIGQRLDQAHKAWSDAMYKLKDGKRHSHTLVGRAERIRKLGAKASKALPRDWIGDQDALPGEEEE